MTFRKPKNSAKVTPKKIRVFDGIGGPKTQILERVNNRSQDISDTIANEIFDLELTQRGSMRLRYGSRKTVDAGNSDDVVSLFSADLGGRRHVGEIINGNLNVVTLEDDSVFPFSPAEEAVAVTNLYPAAEPWMPV